MLTESFFDSQRDALEEAARIRASAGGDGVIVKIDKSSYGGYRVRVVPTDMAMDMIEYLPSLISRRLAL